MLRLPAIPVYLIAAVAGSSFFVLFSTLSGIYRIRAAGLDPLELVLVGTVLELSVFLFEIPTGVVADVYSRRLSCCIGYALIGAGFITESLYPRFDIILLAQVLWGVGFTFTSGAFQAWIVDEVGGRGIGNVFLRGSQAGQLGALLAIGVAVALGRLDLYLPLFAAGVGFLALTLFLSLTMPETGFRARSREERQTWSALFRTFAEGVATVRARPALGWILLIALFVGISSEPLDRFWELHFLENTSFPASADREIVVWFGSITAVSLLLGIGASEWVRRRVDVERPRSALRLLSWGNAALVGAIATFALAESFAVALLCFWTLSVIRRVSSPVLSTWTNQQIPSEVRATVLSMSTQSDSLGQFVGGPALGALGRSLGVRAALLATAGLLLPVQALYRRAHRGETPAPGEGP